MPVSSLADVCAERPVPSRSLQGADPRGARWGNTQWLPTPNKLNAAKDSCAWSVGQWVAPGICPCTVLTFEGEIQNHHPRSPDQSTKVRNSVLQSRAFFPKHSRLSFSSCLNSTKVLLNRPALKTDICQRIRIHKLKRHWARSICARNAPRPRITSEKCFAVRSARYRTHSLQNAL